MGQLIDFILQILGFQTNNEAVNNFLGNNRIPTNNENGGF